MKILQIHNVYIGKTGEEAVVEEERKVLEQNGHQVIQFIKDNSDLQTYSKLERLRMYSTLHASKEIGAQLKSIIQEERPDICHVHNTFPLLGLGASAGISKVRRGCATGPVTRFPKSIVVHLIY